AARVLVPFRPRPGDPVTPAAVWRDEPRDRLPGTAEQRAGSGRPCDVWRRGRLDDSPSERSAPCPAGGHRRAPRLGARNWCDGFALLQLAAVRVGFHLRLSYACRSLRVGSGLDVALPRGLCRQPEPERLPLLTPAPARSALLERVPSPVAA